MNIAITLTGKELDELEMSSDQMRFAISEHLQRPIDDRDDGTLYLSGVDVSIKVL
jgi:hypothetical protein